MRRDAKKIREGREGALKGVYPQGDAKRSAKDAKRC